MPETCVMDLATWLPLDHQLDARLLASSTSIRRFIQTDSLVQFDSSGIGFRLLASYAVGALGIENIKLVARTAGCVAQLAPAARTRQIDSSEPRVGLHRHTKFHS